MQGSLNIDDMVVYESSARVTITWPLHWRKSGLIQTGILGVLMCPKNTSTGITIWTQHVEEWWQYNDKHEQPGESVLTSMSSGPLREHRWLNTSRLIYKTSEVKRTKLNEAGNTFEKADFNSNNILCGRKIKILPEGKKQIRELCEASQPSLTAPLIYFPFSHIRLWFPWSHPAL